MAVETVHLTDQPRSRWGPRRHRRRLTAGNRAHCLPKWWCLVGASLPQNWVGQNWTSLPGSQLALLPFSFSRTSAASRIGARDSHLPDQSPITHMTLNCPFLRLPLRCETPPWVWHVSSRRIGCFGGTREPVRRGGVYSVSVTQRRRRRPVIAENWTMDKESRPPRLRQSWSPTSSQMSSIFRLREQRETTDSVGPTMPGQRRWWAIRSRSSLSIQKTNPTPRGPGTAHWMSIVQPTATGVRVDPGAYRTAPTQRHVSKCLNLMACLL